MNILMSVFSLGVPLICVLFVLYGIVKAIIHYNQSHGKTENRIKGVKDAVLHKDINFFFAGAKDLQEERDMFTNIISQLQTNWKESRISIYGYSYQNFERKMVNGGHENEYCKFIRNNTDTIIFVLNEKIGQYTSLELDVALESFKQSGTPNIYVYSKVSDSTSTLLNEIKHRVDDEKHFWTDYENKSQLRLLIERDLLLRLSEIQKSIEDERKKIIQ